MKKVVALAFLLCVLTMVFAGPIMAQPATIPIKLENPVIYVVDSCPYWSPPDLGFEPLVILSETNTITNPGGEVIGSTTGCQFLKESWTQGGIQHDLYVSFFTFSLPDGDLALHFTNHLKWKASGMSFEIAGTIVGGTDSYADAEGRVWGGGAWPKDMPTPIVVHLILQLE